MGQRHSSVSSVHGACEPGDQGGEGEGDGLLQNGNADDGQAGHVSSGDRSPTTSDSGMQEGVLKIQAISKTWTQRSLIVAYLGYVWFGSS